jgi:photosystem II stability/assembly factor-like uncharacterized protein
MSKSARVGLLAISILVGANFSSCWRDQANRNQQSRQSSSRLSKWVAQYRSPRSAGLTGNVLARFFYSAISVVSPDVVFVAGDMPLSLTTEDRVGVVLKTNTGGSEWSETPLQASGMLVTTLNSIHFVNENAGWTVGADANRSGVIARTTDGGGSWAISRLEQKQIPTSVFFADETNGWIGGATPPAGEDEGSGGPSAILATTDGGTTWQPQINLPVSIDDLFFLNAQTGWASGTKGTVYHTTDGGRSWNSQRTEIETGDSIVIPGTEGAKLFRVLGIQFTDPDHGFAAAAAEEEDTGRLLATSNGGAAWHRQWITADAGLRDVYFSDMNEGWALPDQGAFVYHTIDGGHSWLAESKVFEQDVLLVRVAGADAGHIWAVGGGAIFHRVTE